MVYTSIPVIIYAQKSLKDHIQAMPPPEHLPAEVHQSRLQQTIPAQLHSLMYTLWKQYDCRRTGQQADETWEGPGALKERECLDPSPSQDTPLYFWLFHREISKLCPVSGTLRTLCGSASKCSQMQPSRDPPFTHSRSPGK